MNSGPTFLIVAGEASADVLAADLMLHLRNTFPTSRFFGVGGQQVIARGGEVVVDAADISVVGVSDWMNKAQHVLMSYRNLVKAIDEKNPDFAILIDLPDFNIQLSRVLKRRRIPVIYYVSPQVWAWRKYRVRTLRRNVDRMLVLFPFEEKFYLDHGVCAQWVGHPLAESVASRTSYRAFSERRANPRIAILPGSRQSELRFHAPILREYMARVTEHFPTVQFRIPAASTLGVERVRFELADAPNVTVQSGGARDVLEWADVAMVASGTATLETALVGTPFALYYRLSASSAFFYKHVFRYRGFLGMPNLLAGREIAKEFFQELAHPENLYQETLRLLEDNNVYDQSVADLRQSRHQLGESGASARAAHAIEELVQTCAQEG